MSSVYEIDRLKLKARAGEPLTAREGLWLIERLAQTRSALAEFQSTKAVPHPLLLQMAQDNARAAQLANTVTNPDAVERGSQEWAEWALNDPSFGRENPQTWKDALAGMLESYEMTVRELKPPLCDVIKGYFIGEPARARAILKDTKEASNAS